MQIILDAILKTNGIRAHQVNCHLHCCCFFLFCKFWTLVEWSLKVEQLHVPQNNLQLSLLTFKQSEHLLMIYVDCKQRPRFLSLASLLTNIFLNMFFLIIS